MKYREAAQSRLQKSIHPPNKSQDLPPYSIQAVHPTNPTSSSISTRITQTSTGITNPIIAPSTTPHTRKYINPLSLPFSFINPREVEDLPTVEYQRANLTQQHIFSTMNQEDCPNSESFPLNTRFSPHRKRSCPMRQNTRFRIMKQI